MRTEERKKELGEVFTPVELVNEILDNLDETLWADPNKTWLDNSCGNGNFLVEVKRRLLEEGHSLENVLGRIYGVDLMQDNVEECRERLDPNNEYPNIMEKNIIQADGLRYHYRFDGSPVYDLEPGSIRTEVLDVLGINSDDIDKAKIDDSKNETFKLNSSSFDDLFT